MNPADPDRDCPQCPRLVEFRTQNRGKFPDWHNAPVGSFGPITARILIVGLAPGLRGANRTGRPFTGDYAGDLLYPTLIRYSFADGTYGAEQDDGLALRDCRITNAVRCVPPENKPTPAEVRACGSYLTAEIDSMPNLRGVLALGRIAHDAVLVALGKVRARHGFAHGAAHALDRITLFDSYHCSRYNTNTGRLTPDMFEQVFTRIRAALESR